MIGRGFGLKREGHLEPPIEMRFVDLFMIIVTALMFVTVMLSIISAYVGSARVDVAPRVATSALPTALLGRPYHLTLAGMGGASPYTWTIVDGEAPPGVALDRTTGVLTGRPERTGQSQFTVELSDAERRSDRKELVLTVEDAGKDQQENRTKLHITSTALSLPDALRDEPYRARLAAEGGVPPYRWSTAQGKLPTGLTLTLSGDVIGTPTQSGPSFDVTVNVRDAVGTQARQPIRLAVQDPPTPWWLRVLRFIHDYPIRLLGYLICAVYAYLILFGMEPSYNPGFRGLLRRRRRT